MTNLSPDSVLFGGMVAAAATEYVGSPYVSHADAVRCGAQLKTYPACMESSLDERGFDCSGLVIRAISDVIRLQPDEWAEDVRHVAQMAHHGSRVSVREMQQGHMYPGLLLVFNHRLGDLHIASTHVSVYVGEEQMVHARSKGDDTVALETTAVRGTTKSLAFAVDPFSLVQKGLS